jgi:predicted O-methyltransferase YrrM
MKYPLGMLLDVGCKDRREHNFIGIDVIKGPRIDIVHNIYEKFPYPFKSASCLTIKAAHVIEHVPPRLIFKWMDEMWRLLLPEGQLAVSAPYAGSQGFWQDPTHVTGVTEATFQHFDPDYPLYSLYRPKPWKVEFSSWKPGGNIEAILRKRSTMKISKSVELSSKALSIGAMQKLTELSSLISFLRGKPLKNVLEIGTARGGVFWVLCQISNKLAKIISLDMPRGEFGEGYSLTDVERFKNYAKNGQKLHFLRLDSHEESTKKKVKSLLKNGGLDLLFIDGDHTYHGVKKDWEMYSPLVKKGGYIVFHDICHHTTVPTCQVEQLWRELKKDKKVTEFIDENDINWGGIGVLRV